MKLSVNHISVRVWGKIIVFVLVLSCISIGSSAQQVTISNNLLYDAWLTPNLRVGVRLSPHWSAGVTAGFNPWPSSDETSKKWRHLLVAPDLRYWTDSVNVHHFFGMNLLYSHFNIAEVKFPFGLWKGFRDERREGDMGALGAYYGYSWPLGRHWNLEAYIGAAIGYTSFTRYKCGHCGLKLGRKRELFVMPQAGLSLVYNIPGRPRQQLVEPTEWTPVPVEVPETVVEPQEIPVIEPRPLSVAEQLCQNDPLLAPISEYKPYDRSCVMRKESASLFIYYPVSQYRVLTDYHENGAILDRIIDVTRRVMADSLSRIGKIQIVGLASVDGGLWGNERIAVRRAQSLQQYIQQHADVPDSLFETVGGGEAWADFRDQLQDMMAGDIPHSNAFKVYGVPSQQELQRALDIIDSEQNLDCREQRLRRLNGGRTWLRIRHVLSEQRNSGYVRIYYEVPERPIEKK